MKSVIAGIILLVVVLGGLFVYTESSNTSNAPSIPVQDNTQYNIKID